MATVGILTEELAPNWQVPVSLVEVLFGPGDDRWEHISTYVGTTGAIGLWEKFTLKTGASPVSFAREVHIRKVLPPTSNGFYTFHGMCGGMRLRGEYNPTERKGWFKFTSDPLPGGSRRKS